MAGKKIVVMGLGKTGAATAMFLKDQGARVVLSEQAEAGKLAPDLLQAIRGADIDLELGGHTEATLLAADTIVVSPGVPLTIAPLRQARAKGIAVIGEIELAAGFIQQPLIAVTGTNGKTTTTTLIGQMLQASGREVFVGGNIGRPLIEYVHQKPPAEVVVAEISSSQLDTIVDFRPTVAVLLNIAEDHLARYDRFEDYVRSKGRIVENQQATEMAVLNQADSRVKQAVAGALSRHWWFGRDLPVEAEGGLILENRVDLRAKGRPPGRIMVPPGILQTGHNLENVAAAGLAALAVGGTLEGIQTAVDHFEGLPHRMAPVKTVAGVAYIDDSKATNPDAVRRALESLDRPVIVILGGEDKGCQFEILNPVLRKRAKAVVLLGAAAERLRRCLDIGVPVRTVDSMAAAVQAAARLATPGDVVLLSPACSSFDMYDSYAHRGADFGRAVGQLKGEAR